MARNSNGGTSPLLNNIQSNFIVRCSILISFLLEWLYFETCLTNLQWKCINILFIYNVLTAEPLFMTKVYLCHFDLRTCTVWYITDSYLIEVTKWHLNDVFCSVFVFSTGLGISGCPNNFSDLNSLFQVIETYWNWNCHFPLCYTFENSPIVWFGADVTFYFLGVYVRPLKKLK